MFDLEGDPFWTPGAGLSSSFGSAAGARRTGWRYEADLGARPRGEKRGVRALHRSRSARGSPRPGHARLPLQRRPRRPTLKRLMARARDARGRGRRPPARRGLRRPAARSSGRRCGSGVRATRSRRSSAWPASRARRTMGSGADAVLGYERWLDERATRPSSRRSRAYNEEDCRATLALRDWLLERSARPASRGAGSRRPRADDRGRDVEAASARERAARRRWPTGAASRDRRAGWPASCSSTTAREARPGWWRSSTLQAWTRTSCSTTREALGRPRARGPDRVAATGAIVRVHAALPAAGAQARSGDCAIRRRDRSVDMSARSTTTPARLVIRRRKTLAGEPLPRALIPGSRSRHERPARGARCGWRLAVRDGDGRYPRAARRARRARAPRSPAWPSAPSCRRSTSPSSARSPADSTRATSSSRGRPAPARPDAARA